MHHLLQVSGTPDEVKQMVSEEATKASVSDPAAAKILAPLSQLVAAVLSECDGDVSVSVLCNTHSAEVHPPAVTAAEAEKHGLGALGDGKAQSLSLSIKATLIG